MNKKKLLILYGKSAAGKDTILQYLKQKIPNAHQIISCTSRPPRNYEQDGREYHFITKDDFCNKVNTDQFLEYTYFNGWYYGTPKSEILSNIINIGVFNPTGIQQLLNNYSDTIDILPVEIYADDRTRILRSLNREKNPDYKEICRRFLADETQFSNITFEHEIFLNDDNTNYENILNRPKVADFLKGHI